MQIAVNRLASGGRAKSQRLMLSIALLACSGIAVSSFSLSHHFSRSRTSFCDIGQTFNCDLVNRGTYSRVLGVPVALVGMLGYLLLLALATIYREKAETPLILFISSLGGLLFALRLAYIEAFVLHAWCVLCLGSLAIILATSVLSTVLLGKSVPRS
jgi:uncharacterized membrane protein